MNHKGTPIESRLWSTAEKLRGISRLKSSEYSLPVLGLVFLRSTDHKFQDAATEFSAQTTSRSKTARYGYQALAAAESQAQAAHQGLWASPNPTPPWLWREIQNAYSQTQP